MFLKYGAQLTPGGALITDQEDIVTLQLYDATADFSGGGNTTTVDTDSQGFWEYTWVPTGSADDGWVLKPGPLHWRVNYLGNVRRGSTKSGSMIGPNSLLEFPHLFMSMGEGVIPNAVTGDFAVTAGSLLTANVAAGYASVRGIGVTNPSSRALNFSAAHATLHRIDTVVLELTRTTGDSEGKMVLTVVEGTPDASPVAPTLTQDESTWQYPLADVRFNATATTSTSVTDRRTYPTTTLYRNPTLMTTLRTAPGQTNLTTTATAIAALQHSVTLLNNVWYDILITSDVEVASAAVGGAVSIYSYIDGTGNTSSGNAIGTTAIQTLADAHSRTILGTGAAISCGVMAQEGGTSEGYYYSGMTTVTAIPRT